MNKLGNALLAMAVAGIVFMVAGVSLGGRTSVYLGNSGVNFGFLFNRMNRSSVGRMYSKDVTKRDMLKEERASKRNKSENFSGYYWQTEPINNIKIRVADLDIEIVPSQNEYFVEISEELLDELEVSNNNGFLEIIQNNINGNWGNNNWGNSGEYIRISLPVEQYLEDIDIKTASGDIVISRTQTDNFSLSTASGDIVLKEVSSSNMMYAKSTSGDIEITDCSSKNYGVGSTSGDLSLGNITSFENFECNTVSGGTQVEGEFLGDIYATTVSGEVDLKILGEEQDYRKSFSTVSGAIYLNGDKVGKNFQNKDQAQNTLNVSSVSGNIEIEFITY